MGQQSRGLVPEFLPRVIGGFHSYDNRAWETNWMADFVRADPAKVNGRSAASWPVPGLDLMTRELILVASCVTMGNAMPQLRAHMESAAELGATREQMIEVILQLTFYAGGPAVRNALLMIPDVYGRSK